jgi:hypothetical protein
VGALLLRVIVLAPVFCFVLVCLLLLYILVHPEVLFNALLSSVAGLVQLVPTYLHYVWARSAGGLLPSLPAFAPQPGAEPTPASFSLPEVGQPIHIHVAAPVAPDVDWTLWEQLPAVSCVGFALWFLRRVEPPHAL